MMLRGEEVRSLNLRELWQDWTDTDVAIYDLARVLGIIPPDSIFATEYKWLGNSNNPLGNSLFDFLVKLRDVGVLEADDDWRFRWNATFEVK